MPISRSHLGWWLALALVLVGAWVRLHALPTLPPGLYADEAYYGLDALSVLRGEWQVYFPANNGREPLFIYQLAASVAVFGPSAWAVRLVAAFNGVVTLAALYALGRAWFGRRVALWALLMGVACLWLVVFSRVGLRVGTFPMLLALALAASAWGWRRGRTRWLVLGGALAGLMLYTYAAARLVPVWGLGLVAWWLWHGRGLNGRAAWRWGLSAAGVAAPMLAFAVLNPAVFLGRVEQVAAPTLADIALNAGRVAGMFFWVGDANPRHNLAGRPVFDPASAALFALGLAVLARQARTSLAAWGTLTGLAVLVLPSVLSVEAPHFLRTLGAAPLAVLAAAVGAETAHRWLASRAVPLSRWGLPLVGLAVTAAHLHAYFVGYAQQAGLNFAFQAPVRALAEDLTRATEPVILDKRLWDFGTLGFLAARAPVHIWPMGEPLPPVATSPYRVVALPDDAARAALLAQPAPLAVQVLVGAPFRHDREPDTALRPLDITYRVGGAPGGTPLVRWVNGMNLLAVHTTRTPAGLQVTLTWQASRAPGTRLHVFVQVRAADGWVLAGFDTPAGSPYLPTDTWRAGDVVTHTLTVPLDEAARAQQAGVWMGLYDPTTLTRLPTEAGPDDWPLLP